MRALACMSWRTLQFARRPTEKGCRTILSTTPADGTLAAHCRPKREFGISVKRAALDKIRHSSWRGEEQKRDGTGCRYSLRLLVSDKAQWPTCDVQSRAKTPGRAP